MTDVLTTSRSLRRWGVPPLRVDEDEKGTDGPWLRSDAVSQLS